MLTLDKTNEWIWIEILASEQDTTTKVVQIGDGVICRNSVCHLYVFLVKSQLKLSLLYKAEHAEWS